MSRNHLRASATLALILAFNPAHADDDVPRGEVVVTAERAANDAKAQAAKVPGGTTVVEADAFKDKLAVSLRDALTFAPGVYTQPRFGQEVRIAIRGSGLSRGFHMRGLTLLQDGIPINLADDNGDFQELDPQVFERIAVYRGGNALRYGGSTLGGAIDAQTPTGHTRSGIVGRIDGGSFDTLRTLASFGHADARGDMFAALTTDRSEGDRDHSDRSAVRFTGNIGLRLGTRVETRFSASANHIEQRLPGSLTLAQALATPALSLPANIAGDQQRDIDSLRLQNRTAVAFGRARLAFGGFYNAKQLFHPIFQVIDQKSADRGVFASLNLAGGAWSLTLGTQARFGTVDARQFVNLAGRRGALTADADYSAQTINSYVEGRVQTLPGLSLVLGGIHSHGERKIANRLAPARSGKAVFNAFSPKFGMLYEPAADLQFYANYNRSVEFPGFGELSQTPATGLPGFTPVRAQRAWTAEVGARGSRGIASWDISLYRADLQGEMLQFAIGPNIPAATFNAGPTRHQGIEAGLDLALAPWVRLRQVYQHSDFRFRGDAQFGDNRLPVISRDQYRAEMRLGTDRLNVTPGIEWQPRGPWADYANTVRAPGYVLINLGAAAKLNDRLEVFVDARNLTAKRAVGDVSAVTVANPATIAFYPVERRAFYAGLRARL
jgi:iron complex outermembrane receptor protein